jgi:glyoxylase-like metal-dependent hydrolase (beta-lactamase superfamily II)
MHLIKTNDATILIDPFRLSELSSLEAIGTPTHVIICGNNHVRDAAFYRKRYGARICAHRDLMSKIDVSVDIFFVPGDMLLGLFQTIDMPGTFLGETALLYNLGERNALIVGDAFFNLQREDFIVPGMKLVGFREKLNTMPHAFIKKRGFDSYRKILDYEFDTLLLSHGAPILTGAKERVRDLVLSL